MPRIIKFILFLILFGVVFELGLLSSYTIVTAQPPDVGKLVDMQVTKLTAIWNSITGADKPPQLKTVNITNVDAVAEALKGKTGLSGINVDSLGAVLPSTSTSDTLNVTIVGTGYKENQTGGNKTGAPGGQIVIKQSEVYSVTATAIAKRKSKGVEVDVNTIQITALKKLYNQ